MLDLKHVRENPQHYRDALAKRNHPASALEEILALDIEWRKIKTEADALKAQRNKISLEVAAAKKRGDKNVQSLIAESQAISGKIKAVDESAEMIEGRMREKILYMPNVPDASVPLGADETANPEVRKWGEPKKASKDVLTHYDAAEKLGIVDFERGPKLAGSRFVVLKGFGAMLERALIHFMLATHTKNGYLEMYPPLLVNRKTITGTGQLPKFHEDQYWIERDDMYLIPTAEVPLTNYYADEILEESMLPIKLVAHTPCFRREAGAYGKDIKGLIRQHQFNKVELVKFSKPEDSFNELESMVVDASSILEKLELPYRVIQLCTGDMGFSAAKTYDLEVWIPSQDKYREISSCSNCTDFQARRANIRFRRAGKPEFLHTLNGSGLAVGRTAVAILENYQDQDGVAIPKALRNYMGIDRLDYPKKKL
ncbi:MAG TPA: serine--tRNA ligase [Candidatus Micrarchaeota archaeon]|nr:serine--tRNA ligase [Candidatus Micrarchaeota archaeon]